MPSPVGPLKRSRRPTYGGDRVSVGSGEYVATRARRYAIGRRVKK